MGAETLENYLVSCGSLGSCATITAAFLREVRRRFAGETVPASSSTTVSDAAGADAGLGAAAGPHPAAAIAATTSACDESPRPRGGMSSRADKHCNREVTPDEMWQRKLRTLQQGGDTR